jgi:hypothetical protein
VALWEIVRSAEPYESAGRIHMCMRETYIGKLYKFMTSRGMCAGRGRKVNHSVLLDVGQTTCIMISICIYNGGKMGGWIEEAQYTGRPRLIGPLMIRYRWCEAGALNWWFRHDATLTEAWSISESEKTLKSLLLSKGVEPLLLDLSTPPDSPVC